MKRGRKPTPGGKPPASLPIRWSAADRQLIKQMAACQGIRETTLVRRAVLNYIADMMWKDEET